MNDNFELFTILICIALIICMVLGFNACTESEWNGGICTECETRYELRGVSKHVKYYACPNCGNEVSRY